MKKSAFTFFALILFALTGLFFIATGFLPVDELKKNTRISQNKIEEKYFPSVEFKKIEFQLLNFSDITNISDSISLLNNIFEKNYLTALLKRRKGEFEGAFNILFSMLSNQPGYYQYYDELIFSSKASENIKEIEKVLESEKLQSKYSDYLKALYFYHTNQYSKSIDILAGNKEFEQLYLLSYSYRGFGDYENALSIMNKAEIPVQDNHALLCKVLISKGSLYLLSGRYEEAEILYKAGLESAKQSGNKKEEAKALINLAILDDQNGNIGSAQDKMKQALQISKQIEDIELEATALSELAVSYTYSGNVVEAKINYEKSLEIFRILNHKERLSNLCANIGSLYLQTSNYYSAIYYYNKGIEYAGDNIISQILNHRGLGDVYSNLSNYSKSLEYYQTAKDLAKKVKNISTEVLIDISIGTLYFNINKPTKALQIFLEAKNKIDALSDPYSTEDVLFKIGLAYSSIGSAQKGNEALVQALGISKSVNDIYYQTIITAELGNNFYLQKKFAEAETFIKSAMKLSKEHGFNQLLGVQNIYLGKIAVVKNNYKEALELFNKASALAEKEMDYNNVFEANYLTAKVYYEQKKFDNAEEYYLKAIKLADKISESLVNNAEIQISHFSGVSECYNELAEMYLEQNRSIDAFSIIESSRSRNTFQNLSALKINAAGIKPELLNKYYDFKWMIQSGLYYGEELAKLNGEYSTLSETVYRSANRLPGTNKNLNIKELQKNLETDETLISIFAGDESIYSFLLSKGSFTLEKMSSTKKEIIDLIKKVSPLFDSENNNSKLYFNQDLFSFNTKYAHQVYQELIGPIVKSIPKGNKLIFSMPVEFTFLPIEFLVTDFNKDDSPFYYENKNYLIDDYAVSYSPSSSVYILQKQIEQHSEDKVLLVGDPKTDNRDFALSYRGNLLEEDSFTPRNFLLFPLRYSKEEVQNLNSLFANGYTLLSDDATEKNFKENAELSRIIHLSTHSFLYKDQPLIIFSKSEDDKEDGFLESGEILQLTLNSDLVVLSSCRSGLGKTDESEGVLGMQKAFFEAGAKSIVVSLWDVNDKYTSYFMQSFYEYLSQGFDKSEALRKAKIFFRENYSANPYYWAAFVLSGDVSSIKVSGRSKILYALYLAALILLIGIVFYYLRRVFKLKFQFYN